MSPRDALSRLFRDAPAGLVSVERAAKQLGTDRTTAAKRLAALADQGWLVRARRGLYLVRPLDSAADVPITVDDPWILARELYSPCYIGGWSAAEHWGLTEQIFRSTFVVSAAPRRASSEIVLGAEFRIVRVPRARLRGVGEIWRGAERVRASDPERTLADALANPSWLGGVRHLAAALSAYAVDPEKLIRRMAEVDRGSAYKRLGYLMELTFESPPEKIVKVALRARSKGVVRLDPDVARRGHMSKRWGLWINVDIEEGG